MENIQIIIRGGVIQSIFASMPELKVQIIDIDDLCEEKRYSDDMVPTESNDAFRIY